MQEPNEKEREIIGFAPIMLHDWLKNLALISHPIAIINEINLDSLALVFPRKPLELILLI